MQITNPRAKTRPSRARRELTHPEHASPARKTPWHLFVDSCRLDTGVRRELHAYPSLIGVWRQTFDATTLAALLTECVSVERTTAVRCSLDLLTSASELLTHPAVVAARRGLAGFLRGEDADLRALTADLEAAREADPIDDAAGFDLVGEGLAILEADEPAAALESLVHLVCDLSPWHADRACRCLRVHWSDRFVAGQDALAMFVQSRARRLATQHVDELVFAGELRSAARVAGLGMIETAVEAYPVWRIVGDDGRDRCSIALVAGVAYVTRIER